MTYYLTETGGSADEVTIILGGELDLRAAPALRDALARAIEARVKHVIADLTDATFVDSTAVGALLAASAQIRDSGARLTLICTNKNVLRTVEIAGLHRHIATEPRE
jgi:anti-sigma B factor antagonist